LDYDIFGFIKEQMRGKYYAMNESVQKAVRCCLRTNEADFYHSRMLKLIESWHQCFDRDEVL
jgi:hypothetical protein